MLVKQLMEKEGQGVGGITRTTLIPSLSPLLASGATESRTSLLILSTRGSAPHT